MTSLRWLVSCCYLDQAADAERLRARRFPPLLFRSDFAARVFCIVCIAGGWGRRLAMNLKGRRRDQEALQ